MITRQTVWSLLLHDLYPHNYPITGNPLPNVSLIDSYIWLPFKVEQIIAYTLLYLTTVLIKWAVVVPIRVLTNIRKPRLNTDSLALLTTIATLFLIRNVDTSKIYHNIRSSTLVKLYFMIQVLEVADKLLTTTSFEILSLLYSSNSSPSLILIPPALLYLFLHSYITLYQIVSLNIAVNSYSNALLTVILSNHFSRLKSIVFKKLSPQDDLPRLLKQDASLRFLLLVFLLIVLARNALQAGSSGASHAAQLAALTLASQSLVDALKHVYIAKLNKFSTSTYTSIHTDIVHVYNSAKELPDYHPKSLARELGVSVQVIIVAIYKLLVFPSVRSCARFVTGVDGSARAVRVAVVVALVAAVVSALALVRVLALVGLDWWGKSSGSFTQQVQQSKQSTPKSIPRKKNKPKC